MNYKVTVFLTVVLCCFFAISGSVFGQAVYDTVSIADINFVPDPDTDDVSPLLGDTVVVRGMVMHDPRTLFVGARWATFVVDPDNPQEPWSGYFIIQHDTFAVQTLFGSVEPGWICYFTGVISEFGNLSQSALLTNPPVPITVESVGNALPDPKVLTTADLTTRGAGEQWEALLVSFEDATIVNNAISSNRASLTDASGGLSSIGDYFFFFRNMFNNGTFSWPSNGTRIAARGFVRDNSDFFSIDPRDNDDWEIIGGMPPVINNATRNPSSPTSSDAVEVSATITDDVTVAEATLHWSLNWGPFTQASMTASGDTYSATIPAQADGDFVRYFITAADDNAEGTSVPGDTSFANGNVINYVVRDGGVTIADIQNTYGYGNDASGYVNLTVTLNGSFTVTTDSTTFNGDVYAQEAADRWSGIWVNDISDLGMGNFLTRGDEITSVTGQVQEVFGVTRIDLITDLQWSAGTGTSSDPVVLQTGQINTGGVDAEAYEGVLVRVENVTVSNELPDAPSNFGEFAVDDGSGEVRVDDLSNNFNGNNNLDFTNGLALDYVVGIQYFSFSNNKMLPRDTLDIGISTSIGDDGQLIPETFSLEQNYPNPFNPTTNIVFNIAQSGDYSLEIYNVVGQKISTLFNGQRSPGQHQVTWNAIDDFGNRVGSGIYFYRLTGNNVNLVKKMILLK